MEHSESIKEIGKAIRHFQGDGHKVSKDAINPHFKSKFASLENIIDTIHQPLAANGLSYSQLVDGDGLTTIIMHESGEWIKATAKLTLDKQTPQGQGSAITYMRRYALSAALGIATEDDDDGNSASQPRKTAVGATKPADPHTAAKLKIGRLVTTLGHINVDKDDYPDLIKRLTKLELIPEAFDDIIARLEALVDERNSK